MSHPLVVNKRGSRPYDVYVGRPTRWGNPFSHLKSDHALETVATREEAITKYEMWLRAERPDLIEEARRELRGKTLACWCAPLDCHADLLAEIANGYGWKKSQYGLWQISLPSGWTGSVCEERSMGVVYYTAAAIRPDETWVGRPDHFSKIEEAKATALRLCQ